MVGTLRSSLLERHGFAHGFTTRAGGVSAPPFDAANLARNVGDDPEAVAENHRRLAAALGFERLFELSQVHGRVVREVRADEVPEQVRAEEGDALVARTPGLAIGIRVADCVPLLFADPETGQVAAAHAGWRGVEARIAEAALAKLGAPASRVLVAVGPHIRLGQFEVGPEVADRLEAVAHGVACVDRTGDKPHVDLAAILVAQLRALGVSAIDDVGGCTYSDRTRFFSFRRDGAASGRQLGVIVARAGAPA
ncbi:MAG: peptidoglycan editing factor PgeF [Sandaracinus sp.]|nr:peptidoglycan editing factor PgeF [Myxococcales bacterium]MCB9623455.1 peptidoglycan editing factor PgeF [Sandaracinus sp.]MCB9633091.1 peptidoglycan editing factor PgeF [Sandaracinus sp.]